MTKPTEIQKQIIELTYTLLGESLTLNSSTELSIRGQRIANNLLEELDNVKTTLLILEDEIRQHQKK